MQCSYFGEKTVGKVQWEKDLIYSSNYEVLAV